MEVQKVASLILILFVLRQSEGMSEKQLKAAVKMVRNMCMGKAKSTPEEVDKMHTGNWDIDHSAMCYMYCALNTYKLIGKDNKFDYESAMNQLKQIPDSLQDYTRTCMNKCKNSAVTLNDKCVAAYELAKCMYDCDPVQYFLP